MKYTLRALSALIAYPGEELQANIGSVREAVYAEAVLPGSSLQCLDPLFQAFASEDLLDIQSRYCELFDSSRSRSLHIFEHVHGDGRDRGKALIDLGEAYLAAGFMMEPTELPDFIPVFLEFLSVLPGEQAREWLSQPAHVFAALEERLGGRQSPYAAVFHCLLELSVRAPSREDLGSLADFQDPSTPAEIDQAWEDAPINFNAPLDEATQPSRLVTRLRAARRSAVAEAKGGPHA